MKKKPTWMRSLWKNVNDALRAKPQGTPEEMKAYREAEDTQWSQLELVAAMEAAERKAAWAKHAEWLRTVRKEEAEKGVERIVLTTMTPKSLGFTFGAALAAMKEGEVVARYYWGEGEPEYIFLVPGSHFLVNRPPLLGIFEKGDPIDYGDHIDALMEDHIAPWHPAYVDLLADDWYVLPKECREARNHKPTHQENRS